MSCKKAFIGLMVILLPVLGHGQEVKRLKTGSVLPAINVSNILNGKTGTMQLSQLSAKLLIIDFFHTGCGACIPAIKHLDEMQQAFATQLQAVAVTGQTKKEIQAFLANNKKVRGITLPVITSDTLLCRYFPYRMVPHVVWVLNDTVIAITGYKQVTKENIAAILNNEKIHLPGKNDIIDFDATKPLFVNGNGGDEEGFMYRSIITSYREGLPGMSGWKQSEYGTRVYAINTSLVQLYLVAALQFKTMPANRIRIDTSVITRLKSVAVTEAAKEQWRMANSYCYELIVPDTNTERVHAMMFDDLNRFSGLNGSLIKEKVKCYVLKKAGSTGTGKLTSTPAFKGNTTALAYTLNKLVWMHPVIDEAGNKENIMVDLPGCIQDIPLLQEQLKMQGYTLEESEGVFEFLLIQQRSSNKKPN